MTSMGRGRGWGLAAQKQEPVLRRPGQSISPKNSELNALIDRIYSDVLIDSHSVKQTLNDLAIFADSIGDNFSVDDLVDRLWKQAMDDRCFAVKLMKLYGNAYSSHLVTDKRYLLSSKKGFWQKMQDLYERREELLRDNYSPLINLVWMLGIHVVDCNSESKTLQVMGDALVNCLDVLVGFASEEDIQTVAIQMLCHAKRINKASGVEEHPTIAKIVYKCRSILIDKNVSARSRAHLLLVVEFANRRYEPLDEKLSEFYASIFALSKRPDGKYSNSENGRDFHFDYFLHNVLTKGVRSLSLDSSAVKPTSDSSELSKNESNHEQSVNFARINSGGNSGAPVPRAIRGSGKARTENIKDNGI